MTTLQVSLSDEQMKRLDTLAEQAAEFDRIVSRVLEKNAAFYRRLA